jgi:ribosomal protein L7/L12
MSNDRTIRRSMIDYLLSPSLDHKRVCIELAKAHPALFVKLASKCGAETIEQKTMACIDENGGWPAGKIKGIKFYREATGRTLGEAMEFVQGLYGP